MSRKLVGKRFCEEMQYEPAKCKQRLGKRYILRQVVPDLWANNRQSLASDR